MDVKIYPAKLRGSVFVPANAAASHKAFISSALSDRPTIVAAKTLLPDVNVTSECLKALGASVEFSDGEFLIRPIDKTVRKRATLNFGESFSAFKYLFPTACALKDGIDAVGNGQLSKKNLADYLYALRGVGFTSESLPLEANGRLTCGNYKISALQGSQYLAGLLFALPLLDGDSEVYVDGDISLSSVDGILSALAHSCVIVDKTEKGFFVKGGQRFRAPARETLEGDGLSASVFFAANRFGASVEVENSPVKRGERAKIDLILDDVSGVCDDVSIKISDYLPLAAVGAALGARKVKFSVPASKSNDVRRRVTVNMINGLGGKAELTENGIAVEGTSGLRGGTMIDSFSDSRVALAAVFAALNADKPTTLLTAQAAERAYPGVFNEVIRLGGRAESL